jgi:hypothetical protein
MLANPLTYGLAALRSLMLHSSSGQWPGLTISFPITLLFAVALFLLAARTARKDVAADLH